MDMTKLDVAQRQIETAIRLYFDDADSVSVHTLAAAASEVLRGLCAASGVTANSIRDHGLAGVGSERRRELLAMFKFAENFFKHSDRDPDAVLDFHEEEAWARLLDVCVVFEEFSGRDLPLIRAYEWHSSLTWASDSVEGDWLDSFTSQELAFCQSMPKKCFLAAVSGVGNGGSGRDA